MRSHSSYGLFVIVSGAIAIAAFVAWGFLIYKGFDLKASIAEKTQLVEAASTKSSYLLSIKSALRESKGDRDAIDARFLAKDGIPQYIDMIEGRATATGVKADLNSINLDDAAEGSTVRALRFHISGTGAWEDVARFVSLLESLPYALQIENVSLSKNPSAKVWAVNLDLTQYVAN